MEAIRDLCVSDLSSKRSKIQKIESLCKKILLSGVDNCALVYDLRDKFYHSLRVSFSSVEAMHQAMNLSGNVIDGSLIISIMEKGVLQLSLCFLVKDLAPHVKISEISKLFRSENVNERDPVVHLQNKGYCFVYVASRDHLMECLEKDMTPLAGKPIRVLAGLFLDGPGLKFVSVASLSYLIECVILDQANEEFGLVAGLHPDGMALEFIKKITVVAGLFPDGKGPKFFKFD